MADNHKTLVAGMAVTVMGALVLAMTLFAAAAATGRLIGGQWMGDFFLSLCVAFEDLQTMLKGLGVIVLAGAGYFGATHVGRGRMGSMLVIGLALGIIACVSLLISLTNEELVKNLYQPSLVGDYETEANLRDDARPMVIWAGAALVVCLGAFLGFARKPGDKT